MPKLRVLSGEDVIRILGRFGFMRVGQKGSHVKLQRILLDERKQTLTVPAHKELFKSTTSEIYNQALVYISEAKLRPHFYTE